MVGAGFAGLAAALDLHDAGLSVGVLQAREILMLRLGAVLVTLSACDTSTGATQGQDGVASLVRPFVAAGALRVVDVALASLLVWPFGVRGLALAGVLDEPLPDVFSADVVAVPAKGVERWLSQMPLKQPA